MPTLNLTILIVCMPGQPVRPAGRWPDAVGRHRVAGRTRVGRHRLAIAGVAEG
jgi:hypothetical protein